MKSVYEFKFLIEGQSQSHGAFSEDGEGALKLDTSIFDNEARLQSEMIKGALDTFISVTQSVKKYTGIKNLKVSVFDIQKKK